MLACWIKDLLRQGWSAFVFLALVAYTALFVVLPAVHYLRG
jgi:hypothetical protein